MKPEIKLNQEPLDKTEIQKHMNFDKFIGGYASHAGWLSKAAKIYLSVSASAIVLAGLSYFIYKNSQQNNVPVFFIDPPAASLITDPDKFIINTEKDTTIAFRSGSTISVPAGSFVSKGGKEVFGKIELNYREFHDQVDLIFSGIPMHYDTAGAHYQFESAGMFEIKARQNGEDLVLKPGKEITVNMVSYNSGNYFNVYYLDTMQEKWIFNESNSRACKEKLSDIFNASDIGIEPGEPVKLITPKKANPSLYNFTIDYNKDEFPELAVYDGVKFEISEWEKKFDPKQAQVTWEYVEVKRHNEKQYQVIFRRQEHSSAFVVSPVFDEKDFDKAMEEYERKRKERIYTAMYASDSLKGARASYVREANANNDVNSRFDRAVRRGTVYRSIIIGNMGIWNSDFYMQFARQVARERKEKEIKGGLPVADFARAGNGEKVEMKKLYLVLRNANMIYPLESKDFKQFPLSLAKSVDIIVGITVGNEVLYLKDEELRAVSASAENVIFKMHAIEKKELSDIKSLLDI